METAADFFLNFNSVIIIRREKEKNKLMLHNNENTEGKNQIIVIETVQYRCYARSKSLMQTLYINYSIGVSSIAPT